MEYLLSEAPINKQLIIKTIVESNVDMLRRLGELGFICGQKVYVISVPTKHNRLINIRGTAVALDILLCAKVVVYD